ncbi:MAG TPA: M23 family metallopeptidase [Candidatus Nanopelagicales bacterium]|nr:M23 family metallopeptidase [Candidatus Nanopelagicales bacterium]
MLPLILALVAVAASAVAPASPDVTASPADARWTAPVAPVVLLAPYDPPARRWLPGHRGVDLAAAQGQAVRAAGPGTVTWAGVLVDRGVVVVSHTDGMRTTYEPVDPVVAVGDHVERGELLGTLGSGDVHCGGVPRCLHWGLRRGRDYLDPWLLLHPGRAVLLPP